MGEGKQSARSYLESMSPPNKDREPYLNLPPGYHACFDPEVLVLNRADGSQVALLSSRGFVAEAVEQAAWEDYGQEQEPEEPSFSCASSQRHPPHSRLRPLRPRPPE
jgi:hypothetical protein